MKMLVVLATLAIANAQTPVFEAASIKPTGTPAGNSSMKMAPGRIAMENVSLRKLVLRAWGIPDDRTYAISGPALLNNESFDIQATFAPGATMAELQSMLQALLADRFQLKLHRETRQLPRYTVLVAKGGPLLLPAEPGQARSSGGPGHLEANKISMEKLADLISRQAGLPVVDGTGLTGTFDVSLSWSPAEGITPGDASGTAAESSGPSLFAALREQLGLRLESGKGPVEILVVDHIDRTPSAN